MSSYKVDKESQDMMKTILEGSLDELNVLKSFLFKENIRIENEKRDLEELKNKVFEDRERLKKESDEVNNRIVIERKRLKEEQQFFDKKMNILKNGFEALEADRKALQNARKQFEYERGLYSSNRSSTIISKDNEDIAISLFKGVNSMLSLKKRYKDLLKIFHPDNMGGDHEMVLAINKIYEQLKKNYENSKII